MCRRWKARFIFSVIVRAQHTRRGRLDWLPSLTPRKRSCPFSLELVSQSVHRTCVRAVPTPPRVARLRRCARVWTRLSCPSSRGDRTRGGLTTSARLEAGMRARCAPGVIHHVLYHGGPRLRRRRRCARVGGRWGVAGEAAARAAASAFEHLAARPYAGTATQNANSKWSKVDVVALRRRRLRARRRPACSSRSAVCTGT